ncbi:MAG: type II secretion system F family protein [Ardenticatenaceae bacterium]|nr:type II secretion system F family protein [Ardenticatenaceae bacterium]MCB9444370.1 type II secretion system F family protein [Ardenticatenaceae bacterium]
MKSSKSSQKRTDKIFSDEISAFDIFYQLVYMSATSAAGLSRAKVFELAKRVDSPSAGYFEEVSIIAENLRISYPDSCRLIGERTKLEAIRTFLYRFADALKSGEPLAPFLAREAEVQAGNYENEYDRLLESLKKWNDGYVSVTISAALIVIINMVSTMIYPLGTAVMVGMSFTSVVVTFVLAWVVSRAAPQEVKSVPLAQGSKEQRRAHKLLKASLVLVLFATFALMLFNVPVGWVMIVDAFILLPSGIAVNKIDAHTSKKDSEIGSFFRSLGGAASSRGTTLGDALNHMQLDSFPALEKDINRLGQRLRAFVKPEICWNMFAIESGSQLIKKTTGIFFEAIDLGGDPEKSGNLTSLFATQTARLRAKRQGIADTFSWLIIIMHFVLVALLNFMLEILNQFNTLINGALTEQMTEATTNMGADMLSFLAPQTEMLDELALFLVVMLVLINSFAIVASQGAHLSKISFYTMVMLFLSGLAYLIVPSMVGSMLAGV